MKPIILGMLALAFLCAPAAAACLSTSDARTAIEARHPGSVIAMQTGADAARFIAAYNARPPVTSLDADTVMMARHRTIPLVLVMFFDGGCLAGIERLSPSIVELLLQTVPKPTGTDT